MQPLGKPMDVVFVAVPLMARSGVYRSTHDTVRAARAAGLNWGALIGVRPSAGGEPLTTPGIEEFVYDRHGLSAISALATLLESSEVVNRAKVVVTLITQTDIAMIKVHKRIRGRWVAYVRGLPWPAAGEQGRLRSAGLRLLEAKALNAADDLWTTTPTLAREIASVRDPYIIPAGIAAVPRQSDGSDGASPLVWAGRLDVDKRPGLFAEIVEHSGCRGVAYGEGPLERSLASTSGSSVEWRGWAESASLWKDASIFVGTSSREAFGRSAVEAASAGLPIVIAAQYGAAEFLVTDEELRSVCVVDSPDVSHWVRSVQTLVRDEVLRRRVSDHVNANARLLTVESSVACIQKRLGSLDEGC